MSHATVPLRPATIGQAIVPGVAPAVRAILLVGAGVALTALAAQVRFAIPGTPVPVTGQTAAVLLTGAALGARLGGTSMLLYVLLGAIGLPIFANGSGGVAQLFGATGGYLVGFVVAAALVGRLAERGWDRRTPRAALLMAIGNLVIYACGVPVLAVTYGMSPAAAIEAGALPFLLGDALKIALAAGLLPLAWLAIGRRPR